jgi:hypothetical protein
MFVLIRHAVANGTTQYGLEDGRMYLGVGTLIAIILIILLLLLLF